MLYKKLHVLWQPSVVTGSVRSAVMHGNSWIVFCARELKNAHMKRNLKGNSRDLKKKKHKPWPIVHNV